MKHRPPLPSSAPAPSATFWVILSCLLRPRPSGCQTRTTRMSSRFRTGLRLTLMSLPRRGTPRFWMASTRSSRDAASVTGHADMAWPAPRVLPWLTSQLIDWLPALPLILLALALLIVPTVMVVAQSLRDGTGAWTAQVWAETLQRRGDQRAIVTSLGLGVVCATVSILVGAPVAWFLARATTLMRASWLSLLNVGANFSGIGLAFGFIASLGSTVWSRCSCRRPVSPSFRRARRRSWGWPSATSIRM